MRRDFGIAGIQRHCGPMEIGHRDLAVSPFCALTEFTGTPRAGSRLLLVAPLSGHFAFILREMVMGFLPTASVYVTDWINARFVPVSAGDFGFDDNIEAIVRSIEQLGPGVDVCALCQAVVPALAATAILSRQAPGFAPRSLTLIGGPVDPLANPTRVVRLLRQRPLKALETEAIGTVGAGFPGEGRLVYPGLYQRSALLAYLYRNVMSGGELMQKLFADDGLDPIRFPFLDLFSSVMDLPATCFLQNIQTVFLDRQPWTGQLRWRGQRVDFGAILNTALMTVEGSRDDIAAPGQTSAAHRLCSNIPNTMRRRLVVDGAGHFSLFYGRTWRDTILPDIEAFRRTSPAARSRLLPLGQQAPLPFGASQRRNESRVAPGIVRPG